MKGEDKINNLREELMEKIDDIKEDVANVRVDIAKLPELLADKFDQRYASKEYESSLKKLNWMVISAVFIAVLSLVIKSGI